MNQLPDIDTLTWLVIGWVSLALVTSIFVGAILYTCSSDKHMVTRLRKAGL